MAVYEKRGSAGAISHTETHLYGSSRLGILKELTKNPVNITVANAPANSKVITFTRGEKPACQQASSLKPDYRS